MLRFIPLSLFAIGCAQLSDKQPAMLTASTGQVTVSAAASNSNLSDSNSYYFNLVKGFIDTTFGEKLNGSILVARNGQVLYEKYSGFENPRGYGDSITATTPFHLASVSKTFTAMATLKLWNDGKLQIDSLVSAYLPGFPCTGVTVRMLLNHRSGLPKYDHYMSSLGWNRKKIMTNQDVLDFLIANRKKIMVGRPDRGFSYSNTNYALLALIVEKVSGQFYGDYLKNTFFDSLGMRDTYVFTRADSARSLPSYYYNGRQYAFDFLDMVYGDKNIYSTPRDLLKWDQALSSGRFFTPETLNAAYTPYSNEKPGTHNYGLGWRMYVLKNGKKLIYHTGWWHGNRTIFVRLLDEDVTIVALCNNDARNIYTAKEMADYFGDYMQHVDRGSDDDRVARNTPVRKSSRGKRYTSSKKQLLAKNTKSKKTTKKRSTTTSYAGKAARK
ncbi:serine hydrolase domain-containing protein [Paraflavitalea sp. CAU 1676]|uniref:serine hydrolase domain-containing protein n=1 Tax=Paraflavitalea sp. CAU 1676 TaxID=3032598 RepID=UPI0023D9E0FF|nr:serine hydrolase domain-containing protein [Paraflavitalea sp. CAU 1676]MDF2187837.1 serine hydrolase [Paraflavitalea sp. CAU 1676]